MTFNMTQKNDLKSFSYLVISRRHLPKLKIIGRHQRSRCKINTNRRWSPMQTEKSGYEVYRAPCNICWSEGWDFLGLHRRLRCRPRNPDMRFTELHAISVGSRVGIFSVCIGDREIQIWGLPSSMQYLLIRGLGFSRSASETNDWLFVLPIFGNIAFLHNISIISSFFDNWCCMTAKSERHPDCFSSSFLLFFFNLFIYLFFIMLKRRL